MLILFKDKQKQLVGRWVNIEYADHGTPQIGDHVILHHGDYNEFAQEFVIKYRTFDGTKLNVLVATVEAVGKEYKV